MLLSPDADTRARLEAYAKDIAHISKTESLTIASQALCAQVKREFTSSKSLVVVSLEGLVDFEEEVSY